jgi:hypothetical protein
MNEFEDDLIADALRGRAGSGDLGIDGALAAVTGRATATRRRRAAIAGMGAMTGIVAVAALAFAGGSSDIVRTPNDSVPSSGPVSSDSDPNPDSGLTPSPTATDGDPTTTKPPSTSVDPVTTSVAGGVMPSSTPPVSPPSSSPTSSPPSTSLATAPPSTTTPDDPETTEPDDPETTEPDDDQPTPPFSGRVYESEGGSISVSWNGTDLNLGAVDAAAGYTSSIEDQDGDRIRVRFEGANDWQIEVRADGNGVVSSSVSS